MPALLFFKNGDLQKQLIPAAPDLGGERMTPLIVEFVLAGYGQITPDEPFEEDPRDKMKLMNTRIIKKKDAGRCLEEDDEGEDDREYMNNQMFRYK